MKSAAHATGVQPSTPRGWLRMAMTELRGAERAYQEHNSRGAVLGLKRAAGMALRGVVQQTPSLAYGESYMDHLEALAVDASVPTAVQTSAQKILSARGSDSSLVILRANKDQRELLEATRDVLAHAYACIVRAE